MSSSVHTKSDGSSSGYHYKTKVSNGEKVLIDWLIDYKFNRKNYIFKDVFLQLREIFAILTQGVELVQYDVKNGRRGVSKFKRILWIVCNSMHVLFYID